MDLKIAIKIHKILNDRNRGILTIVVFIFIILTSSNKILNRIDLFLWFGLIGLLIISAFIEGRLELIINKQKRSEFIKNEDEWWQEHPPKERVKLTDNKNGEFIGSITNEQLRFLINGFTKMHMEDNDFYFLNELFDSIAKEFNFDPELKELIWKALKDKSAIEVHWEK